MAEIVRRTKGETPEGQTHWSCRSMAKAAGVSPATVQRIWSARGLKLHLVKTFKLLSHPGVRRPRPGASARTVPASKRRCWAAV